MLKILYLTIIFGFVNCFYIYDKTDPNDLENARKIGENAKIRYFQDVMGLLDEKKRHSFYLDGLTKCDEIGNKYAETVQGRVIHESNITAAKELRKVGLRYFQAQFTTVSLPLMKDVIHMACSKHEQQLQCGAVYEGEQEINKRIQDLKSIGNHLLMFNHECKDPEFAIKVYPCIGKSVEYLRNNCGKMMDTYFNYREDANVKIAEIYDTSLSSVKKLKASGNGHQDILNKFIFNNAMKQIVQLEGRKCELFKKMRECVLPVINKQCGQMAAQVLDTGISIGYLRIERKERLNLDFDVFGIPSDPKCFGL